jgi:hypothetical protein
MRRWDLVGCGSVPCTDVRHQSYCVPSLDVRPADVSVVLVSEAAAADPADGCCAGPGSLFERTTVEAFRTAGGAP